MAKGREYELKFEIGPHDIAAFCMAMGPPDDTRRLVSTYFDTDDKILRRKHVALRARRTPDGLVHTLKRTGASIVDREEWEHESRQPTPDVAWLRSTPLKRFFKPSVTAALGPRFTVNVHRASFTLRRDGATIEGALDRGAIETGDRSGAVHEFELELKAGRPKALLSLAREMADEAPLVLSLASKSERGYALADGTWGLPTKALALRLRADATRGEAFEAIVQACLHLFLVNAALLGSHDETRDPGHVEAVHKARVALRRLRAALQLFAPVLRRRWRRTLRADVKWMSDRFGAARDADVFLAEVSTQLGAEPDADGQALLDLIVERRKTARSKLRRALASPRWRTACLDLVAASDRGVRRGQRKKRFRPYANRQFATRLGTLAKRARGLKTLSEESRHDVRKMAKMLRYGLDFVAGTPGLLAHARRFARLRADLQHLQTALGTIHDGDALRAHLRDDLAPRARDGRAATAAEAIAGREADDAGSLRQAAKAARRVCGSKAFAKSNVRCCGLATTKKTRARTNR